MTEGANMVRQYKWVVHRPNNPIYFGKQIYATAFRSIMGTLTARKFIANLTDYEKVHQTGQACRTPFNACTKKTVESARGGLKV